MTLVDATLFAKWIAAAARAPSAHNTQPARWKLTPAGIELHEDATRWLSAGDPTARDQRIALGMAWEALSLAMSADGWHLAQPIFDTLDWPASPTQLRRIGRAAFDTGAQVDPLADWQVHRHCWRGAFASANPAMQAALRAALRPFSNVALAVPEEAAPLLADSYDRAAATLLADAATADELLRWMRFSARDVRWTRDGLAANCMALSTLEAYAASWLMRPRALAWLRRFGLLKLLVAERAKTLSATGLVVIHAEADAVPFNVGRAWYRCWLGLTAAGFAAVPMSALVDDRQARAKLMDAVSLPEGRVPFNVMRVGPMPKSAAPASARLPIDELVLTSA